MSAISSIYRPLTPATPAHTPHGSVGSIRSRTPGQLSLHEYRRQQSSASPLAEEGNKRLRKKVSVLNLHNGIQGIPTAPPTPLDDTEFDVPADSDEEDEEIINANFIKYSVRAAKKDYVEQREGASRRLLSGPHHRTTSSSSTSINSRSAVLPPLTIITTTRRQSSRNRLVQTETPRRAHVSSGLVKFDPSPPHSPATPLLPQHPLHPTPSPEFTFSTPASILHHSMNIPSPIVTNDRDIEGSSPRRDIHFKPIKHLPRPMQPPLDPPPVPSPVPSNHQPGTPATNSSLYSPFSLSKFQFPPIPTHKQESQLRKSQSYDDAAFDPPPQHSVPPTAMSFTDLVHLYGGDFKLLNKHESFESGKLSLSHSEGSSQDLHPLPIFAPKQPLPKMSSFVIDPFNTANQSIQNPGSTAPLNRESMYTENWDSRSIIGNNENLPPGRALGIVDYSDVQTHNPQHDSYTPVNQIFNQYGCFSSDSNMPWTHLSAGRPPASPPPPVPALPLPELNLPMEDSTVDHTTDYGMTRDLLRDYSSTRFEFPRSDRQRLEPLRIPSQEYPSSVYDTSATPMPAFGGDPDTLSLALSAVSDEWQTIANTSTNELTGNITSMADYSFSPFPTHYMPPLHATHQRRAITYDEIPEVPSPQSTLPELDGVFRHGDRSPTPGFDHSVMSDYSPRAAPDTPDNYCPSPMRYTLYDGADMIDVSQDDSPIGGVSKSTHKRNVSHVEQLPSTEEQCEVLVTVPKHDSFKGPGIVDPNTLSSEPNDAIDMASLHSVSESKQRTRLSMLLGRGSKRSSRNFSNQRDLIELEMPKRTSSLRATEPQNPGHHHATQIEGGSLPNASILAVTSQDGSQDPQTDQIRTQEQSRGLYKGRPDRRSRILGLALTQGLREPTRAYARPASSAASTEPLIHEGDHRNHLFHHTQAMPSLGGSELGGLRQLYLAEEGAYSNNSPGMKAPAAAIAFSDPEYKRQLRLTRIWFAVFLPFPFCMVLYSLGAVDRLAGPRGMLKNYKKWARNVVFLEIVMILVALTVWGVARRGG
jgi:hypothetical protein